MKKVYVDVLAISIHAPTRGATFLYYCTNASTSDFNPRSYKRSDTKYLPTNSATLPFQSTLLQEERPLKFPPTIADVKISIHAPTRGATLVQLPIYNGYKNFNPRSYKRSDCRENDR